MEENNTAQESLGSTDKLEEFKKRVEEARELLNFAETEWPAIRRNKQKSGEAVGQLEDATVATICGIEEKLVAGASPTPDDRSRFEDAYRDLSEALAPVNIHTLRATSDEYANMAEGRRYSRARSWATKLWAGTIVFILIVILFELLSALPKVLGITGPDKPYPLLISVAEYLKPFAYGGLGACTYLLRSCVYYIGLREFDPKLIPQYSNRILLGVVGGGIVYYIIAESNGTSEISTGMKLTASMFGFLAGYFNDRVFKMLERLADAVFPGITLKVAEATTPSKPPSPPPAALLDKIVEEIKVTEDPEAKKVLTGLLDRLGKQAR